MSDKQKTTSITLNDEKTVIEVNETVMLSGKSDRKVTVTNITPNWVIFTDLADGKRKDCTVDAFKKNASKLVELNVNEVIADAGPIEDKQPVFGINIHKSGSNAEAIDEWSTQKDKVVAKTKLREPGTYVKGVHTGTKSGVMEVSRLRNYGLKKDNQVYVDANGKSHAFTDKQHFIIHTLSKNVGFMSPTEIGKLYGQSLYEKSKDEKDLKMASSAVSKSCLALVEKGLLVRSEKGHYKID